MPLFKKFFLQLIIAPLFLLSIPVVAEDNQGVKDEISPIQAQLKKMIQGDDSVKITATPIAGLYQVQLGVAVVYMSQDGKFLMNGSIINLDSKENLTELAESAERKLLMEKIPESSMIVYPAKGKKKHFITVFSDIDCPFCVKLHKEIPTLNAAGVTVRYLAYPRAGLGSGSYLKSVSVWCADEPTSAMDNAMLGVDIEPKSCLNPVSEHIIQARVFRVTGTPSIVLDNGDILPGYVSAKNLIKVLSAKSLSTTD